MTKSILILAVGLSWGAFAAADEFKLSGMPSLAFNTGNSFINFGGPSVKLESEEYFGGVSFFPSLRHNSSANEWTPVLGAGVFAGRKNIFIILPSYYLASNWYTAFGLGYRF